MLGTSIPVFLTKGNLIEPRYNIQLALRLQRGPQSPSSASGLNDRPEECGAHEAKTQLNVSLLQKQVGLDLGESESIVLAQELEAELLLLDERKRQKSGSGTVGGRKGWLAAICLGQE
jgi:hypothetical protein